MTWYGAGTLMAMAFTFGLVTHDKDRSTPQKIFIIVFTGLTWIIILPYVLGQYVYFSDKERK